MEMDDGRRRSKSRTLYDEIRDRIADGTYQPGTPLPSTRSLASERGLSRTTVSAVYEQLASEGLIESRAGATSLVAAAIHPRAQPDHEACAGATHRHAGQLSSIGARVAALELPEVTQTIGNEIDFVYGPLAGRDFPTLPWLKALRAVERQRSSRLAYDNPCGNIELRKALQKHLSQSRGLSCSVDQLLIVNGSQQALDLCARLLISPDDSVVVENPGYRIAHHVFETYGAKLIPIEVDGHGLRAELLAEVPRAQVAYVTPTHQFPLGGFLPIGRRHELLTWAAERNAWIIEDDYDSEYRYSVRPEATLQSLDSHGCVIHVGTFSKTLSPQLRLGYMVLPPRLVDVFCAAKQLTDRHVATGTQHALAALLKNGSYDRHVRRIRRLQHARQNALVQALVSYLGDRVEVLGAASGLHLVVRFRVLPVEKELALIQAAHQRGIRLYPLSQFFHPAGRTDASKGSACLVMGYALLEREQIEEGVRRLADALQGLESTHF